MGESLTVEVLARALVAARVELAAQEQVLNSLNVFPVPDGDTGTNMLATLSSAVEALQGAPEGRRAQLSHVMRAMTRSAQGNSGVILAEYVRGFVSAIHVVGPVEAVEPEYGLDTEGFVRALNAAATAARGAVDRPVEGTMLSIAEGAAAAATAHRGEMRRRGQILTFGDVANAAVEGGTAALRRSPHQLEELSEAGVVDAGGAGLVLTLECLHRVVSGRFGLPAPSARTWLAPRRGGSLRAEDACQVLAGGPAFELMGVIEGMDDAAAAMLREELSSVGDSVVVAGGDGVHRLHVHTDDVLGCGSCARTFGDLGRISVTRFEGPLEWMGGVRVHVTDDLVAHYARALGALCIGSEDKPRGAALEEVTHVLWDGRGKLSGRLRKRLVGSATLVGVLEGLDELVVAEGEDLDEDLPVSTLFEAETWAGAIDKAVASGETFEQAIVLLRPDAPASHADALLDGLALHGVEGHVFRLDSGHEVQMGCL